MTGNPYHLPKGPKGGEFTHGPDSAKAKEVHKRQYVYLHQVKTARGSLNKLQTNEGNYVKVGRKQFNKLIDENRVHYVSSHEKK